MKIMTLEETQACCLRILKRIDVECKKQGLVYFLIGGSALGAIRHKGIIPWDDDIDVGLLRADYEKFCDAFQDDTDYSLLMIEKTPNYFTPYAKLCDNRTLFIEPSSKNRHIGVFVDVFPIDYIDASNLAMKRALWKKRLYCHSFLRNLDIYKQSGELILKRFARKLMSQWYVRSNPATLIAEIQRGVISKTPTDKMMNFWGTWGMREIVDTQWFGEGVMVPFEDMECRVPAKWDDYLSTLYNDYMTLPPLTSRKTHGQAYLLTDND